MPIRMASPYGAFQSEYPPKIFDGLSVTKVPLIGDGGWMESFTSPNDPVQEEVAMPQKPDAVTAKSNDKPFPIHPEGQFAARCVDVINLGEAVVTYPGTPTYLAEKVALGFWTGEKDHESGKEVSLVMEFTLSMGKKSNMRAFLESWRGRSYTDEQAKDGVPIDKLYGASALISVEHKESKSGKAYARIKSIAPLPKQMESVLPKVEGIAYERDEWWTKKKDANAQEVLEFRKSIGAPPSGKGNDFADFPESNDGDDDLPF